MPQAVHSGSEAKFSRFWCDYLQAHAHAGTRALHYLGTIVGFQTEGCRPKPTPRLIMS